jgi:hypothetical protein
LYVRLALGTRVAAGEPWAGTARRGVFGRKYGEVPLTREELLAEAELLDHCPVALDFGQLQIVEQPSPLTYHPEQPTATVMVALVDFEVLREVLDSFREQRDLDLRRAGIGLVGLELSYYFALSLRR